MSTGRLVEAERLLTGRGHYLADVKCDRLCHVAFVRSPHPHAEIQAIDTATARGAPGVVAVITGTDLQPAVEIRSDSEYQTPTRPVLPTDRVRFEGEAVAAVVAADPQAAAYAAQLVDVHYHPLPTANDAPAAAQPQAIRVHPGFESNVAIQRVVEGGDVDTAFSGAPVVIRQRFRTRRGIGRPIENRGSLAVPDRATGGLHLWLPSQIPGLVRDELARLLNLNEHQVQVSLPDIGGSFGTKNGLTPDDVTVAWLALHLRRPCRWLESHAESILCSSHGHEHWYELELAAGADGQIRALRGRIYVDLGAYSHWPWTAGLEPIQAAGLLPGPYKIRNYRCEVLGVLTNKAPVGPLRGVARPSATFALERMMEELARRTEQDPVQCRRRNLVQTEDFPYRTVTNLIHQQGSYVEALDLLYESMGYATWRERQAEARKQGRWLGLGVACGLELGGIGSGMPVAPGTCMRPGIDGVTLRIDPSGSATVVAAVPSFGQGPDSLAVTLVSRELGIPARQVALVRQHLQAAPYTMGVFAGRGTIIIGGAIAKAAGTIKERLLRIAGHLLGQSPDELTIADGKVYSETAATGLTIAELARISYFEAHRLPPDLGPGLGVTEYYDPRYGVSANCAHGAVVEVDPDTFETTVLHYTAVTDGGQIVDQPTAEGQVVGGIVHGLGLAFMERLDYDANGCLLYPRSASYPIPRAADVPPITLKFLHSRSQNLTGSKPVGQSGTIVAPAVVANAISDALHPLGVGVSDLPIMPSDLWSQLNRKPQAGSPLC